MFQTNTRPSGSVGMSVTRAADLFAPGRPLTDTQIYEVTKPRVGLPDEVNDWRSDNRPRIIDELKGVGYARSVATKYGLPHLWTQLWLRVKRAGSNDFLPYGFASFRVVTTTGAGFIVDAWQNTVELEIMRYHGIGTGSTGAAVGDTALETELTTQYNPDSTRATGSLTEGASANIFKTVGTNTVDAAAAVTEHGILSQAATGGGVLLDRHTFSVINLGDGDSLESTYEFTITTGG